MRRGWLGMAGAAAMFWAVGLAGCGDRAEQAAGPTGAVQSQDTAPSMAAGVVTLNVKGMS